MRLRLHRDGRLDGRGRRAQDGTHARAGPAPAHPDRVAARLGRRPHPGDRRVDVRRRRRAVPRAGHAVGRRAPGGGACSGHCAAGTAYIPALADFVPMVKGTSSMALGGRHLVKAATGEDVTEEEMGGSAVHTKISGVADLEVGRRRRVPGHRHALPVVLPAAQPGGAAGHGLPTTRSTGAVEELYDIVPTAPRRAYDMRQGDRARSSTTASFFEMKPEWARNVVTGFARVGGQPVGHRRQPAQGARRRARRELGRQGGPLRVAVRRVRHPARVPARRARASSSARRWRSRASSATAPRCCSPSPRPRCRRSRVVLRKSYGAGYFVMNGTAYEADYIAAWPTAEIAVMGPDGMVNIIMRKQLDAVPRGQGARRGPHRHGRASSARTSTRTSPPATPRSTT